MIEILTNIGTGSLGAFTYLWWYALHKITLNDWSWQIHVKENLKRWVWIETGLILLALVSYITPEAFELILHQKSIKIPNIAVKGVFLLLGYFIAKIAKNKVDKTV